MLHTPKGSFALSLVQLGTLLLNGQRRFERYRVPLTDLSSMRCPNTSASGCKGLDIFEVFFSFMFQVARIAVTFQPLPSILRVDPRLNTSVRSLLNRRWSVG